MPNSLLQKSPDNLQVPAPIFRLDLGQVEVETEYSNIILGNLPPLPFFSESREDRIKAVRQQALHSDSRLPLGFRLPLLTAMERRRCGNQVLDHKGRPDLGVGIYTAYAGGDRFFGVCYSLHDNGWLRAQDHDEHVEPSWGGFQQSR